MPSYDYVCTDPNCCSIQEEDVKISEFKNFRPECIVCGSECKYHFTPTVIQFALKDGPSGSWPSKGNRFKKYRENQNQKMERKQKDRYGHLNRDCIPNYNGQQTENWSEAQSLAMHDKDKNPDSLATAATFNTHITKEKKKKGNPISA